MSKGKPDSSKYIPNKKKAAAPHRDSRPTQAPKRGIQDLVYETIIAMGDRATVKGLFPLLLGKMTNEQIITSLNRLDSQDRIHVSQRGQINIGARRGPTPPRNSHDGATLSGRVDITKTGAAFVTVEGYDKDFYIPTRYVNHALQGDTVTIIVTPARKGKPEGKITAITRRAQESFTGVVEVFDGHGMVTPDEHKLRSKIWISADRLNSAVTGDKVFVRILDWNEKGKFPIAEVSEVMGVTRQNDLDMKLILIQNGFHNEFPQDAVSELNKIPDAIPAAELVNRVDYRDILTFTIDPVDAKDFDDALSYRLLPNGNHEIGIHIADVSHYLKQGSELDKEAERRATSVYLPDRVCPMLPERLSNFLCSLRPNEDKLTFAAIFEFDKDLKVIHTSIAKTVIHSRRRYTYEEVQEVLETGKGDYVSELKLLDVIAKKIREARVKKGAIAFEKAEVRFLLNEEGKPIDVYTKVRKDAHLLVEDFMLLANEAVAKYGSRLNVEKPTQPFVYRVHDSPDPGKLQLFATVAKRFGYQVSFKDPKDAAFTLNTMLQKIQGRPEQNLLETMAIRCMAKAEYTTKNIGHYGLAMDYYTHFTSPIRRYPDVMVHRLVYEQLTNQPHGLSKDEIEGYCKNSSLMERRAMDAEREATKYKQVEFLEDKVGQDFDGIISGIIARGIFVELVDNKCEGFVSTDDLGNEDFVYEEANIRLRGRRSGIIYDIGQPIRVRIKRTNLAARKIDLTPTT